MLLDRRPKQPRERRMVQTSYEHALHTGDSVVSAELVDVSPSGALTADTFTVINGQQVRFWIDDGEDNTRYVVTWKTVTATGEEFEDEIMVVVRERP